MPCIGPSTASNPVEHDASWSDPVERLVLWSHDRVDPVDRLYKVGLKIELSSLGRGRAEKEGREKREKGDKEKRER